MKVIPPSGSVKWKLEQWKECIDDCNKTPDRHCDLSAIKEVVEECLKCRCAIPQEILDRLAEESFQQKHTTEVPPLQLIVQKFQELVENVDTKTLLKECTQIIIHCNHTIKQTRLFRMYAFVTQIDQPAISFSDDKQNDKCNVYFLRPPKERVPITFEITVFKHLMDNITDWPSLEFTIQAKNYLSAVIEKALPESFCNILEVITKDLEKSVSNLTSILQYLLLRTLAEASENATIKKELLSPWQLFVVVQRLIQNKSPQNDDVVRNVLLRDLQEHCCRRLSKLQFIFLLPCVNYLSFLHEKNPLISSFPSKFEEGSVWEGKYDDLDKKVTSILDTDLTLLKMGNDAVAQSSNPYARVQRHQVEMYVIKLLQHYSDESRLCQSVLEFLFAQSEEIWNNICQSDNGDKCWRVMCIAFQNDFSMWNKFIERLQIVNIFEDDKVRSTFFKNFKVNSTFRQLVTTSSQHLFDFFGFIQTQKNIWKSDDDLLTTIERYINNIFYCEKIMSCLINILWNVLSIFSFEVSLEDNFISDKVIELTEQLLENIRTIREQRQSESESSLQ
ncbi:hypothetical protein RFI_36567, partial [Reticulomyxa filosa]